MMPGIPELIVILIIVMLIFGSKRLKNIGKDLGSSIKNFKKSMRDKSTKEASDKKEKNNK